MNRFFTVVELANAYRLPLHIHDQFFDEVLPVEKSDQGDPLFLEAHVDAWLTARFSVDPWRSGCAVHDLSLNSMSNADQNTQRGEDKTAFVTVAEAKRRYLAGRKSLRWWYRMIEKKMFAHHRVGVSILLRIDDIERFIDESRMDDAPETPPDPAPPIPVGPHSEKRHVRTKPGKNDGRFRFFPR